ncbi:hypothetical protein BD779DRAFT_330102 [Infundibulicybe gibba]|nr:hypothetical protein BD779DRAFT_330102 [Infundibulicybe gibba]
MDSSPTRSKPIDCRVIHDHHSPSLPNAPVRTYLYNLSGVSKLTIRQSPRSKSRNARYLVASFLTPPRPNRPTRNASRHLRIRPDTRRLNPTHALAPAPHLGHDAFSPYQPRSRNIPPQPSYAIPLLETANPNYLTVTTFTTAYLHNRPNTLCLVIDAHSASAYLSSNSHPPIRMLFLQNYSPDAPASDMTHPCATMTTLLGTSDGRCAPI